MPSRSRQRQLAKLAQRRKQERRRQRRQRILAGVVAAAVAVGGGAFAAVALLGGSDNPTPAATDTPTAGPVACGGEVPAAASSVTKLNERYPKPPPMTIDTSKRYVATMQTSCGTIELELDAKTAPNTVNSLVFLARQHFFDGSTFHRVVPGFVIQGGDPTGTGSGGPGYTVVDPPPENADYSIGTLAMAKTGTEPAGTAGSQFFIVTAASAQEALAPGGKGLYAIAGHVISGTDAVDKIAAVPVGGPTGDTPQQTIYIEKVTISEK